MGDLMEHHSNRTAAGLCPVENREDSRLTKVSSSEYAPTGLNRQHQLLVRKTAAISSVHSMPNAATEVTSPLHAMKPAAPKSTGSSDVPHGQPTDSPALCSEEDRRDLGQTRNRAMGYVVSCDGARAVIHAVADHVSEDQHTQWAIGRLISINIGKSRIVGLIQKIEASETAWNTGDSNKILVQVELQGEVIDGDSPANAIFRQGISNYPNVGAIAHQIRLNDLKTIFQNNGDEYAAIGALSQDASVPAIISIEQMISKHFAILGSTGCGKSSATSLILHRIQEKMPDLRVLILDPHNEYSRGFKDVSATLDINSLELPHWLFRLDEFTEVLFHGDPSTAQERDVLRELVLQAKTAYAQNTVEPSLRKTTHNKGITAESAIPYRISDLLRAADEQIGSLEQTTDRPVFKSLRTRIDALANDPQYAFMFTSRIITDNAVELLGKLFRIPAEGKPVSIIHMADIPGAVVNSLVSVLCRLAFDLTLASNGKLKVLVVCEEAHRYISEDKTLGFLPTRRAIARIAKEGRKYGSFLCIISQRPGELDPTILSQCSTVFSMRLSNEADQNIVRMAISAASASTVSFLSSIGNREAIAFGEGISTPMRLRFSDLPDEWLLGHDKQDTGIDTELTNDIGLSQMLVNWRRNQR